MSLNNEIFIEASEQGFTVETSDGSSVDVSTFFGDPVVIEAVVNFDISDPTPPSIIDGGSANTTYIDVIDGGDSTS